MPEFELISLEIKKYIVHLRLNNPPVNALNQKIVSEITEAVRIITEKALKSEVRCMVISGVGSHFCAGADLKERAKMPERKIAKVVRDIQNMTTAVAEIPVPVIAAIYGAALGGGLELALAADFRVVSSESKLGFPETSIGVIPGAGGTQRLARVMGESDALYWIVTAEKIHGVDAYEWGIANFVGPDEEVIPIAKKIAQKIVANAPIAVRAAKEAVRKGNECNLTEGLKIESDCYAKTIKTRDRVEALTAFLEKRRPGFIGE